MKRVLLALLLSLCLISVTACKKDTKETESSGKPEVTQAAVEALSTEEIADETLVKNGDFLKANTDPEEWFVFTQGGGGSFQVEDEEGVVTVTAPGSINYAVQLYQDIGKLVQGCKYKISFDIRGSHERTIEYRIQMNGGDYHAYAGKEEFKITKENQTETLEFSMEDPTDPAPRFCINCGQFNDTESLPEHKIYLDNISVEMIDDSAAVDMGEDETKALDVNINQIGYLPNDVKTAIFRGDSMDETFEIQDAKSNQIVYTGKIENEFDNVTAKEMNYYGDFSGFVTPGTYIIHTETHGDSYPFAIGEGIYDDCYKDAVTMLYKQRCGCKVEASYAGDYAHEACHTGKALVYGTKKKIDVTGGWHDAGDYGRYVVPGAKTVYDLFLTVEQGESALRDDLGIPESGNSVPDLLDEARYELEWMLKMQDAKTGGVYHKVTCSNFPGDDVMPEDETEQLIICPISDAATFDFAAVMARASEVYKPYDKEFASNCLKAAEKAMDYGEKQETLSGFKNPDDIVTGEYGDTNIDDERYWAMCEFYRINKSDQYLKIIKDSIARKVPNGFGWAGVGNYGSYAFLTTEGAKNTDIYRCIYDSFMGEADTIADDSKYDGYLISLGFAYNWGSNMTVMNNAMHLILADSLTSSDDYLNCAKNHLHYCLGSNPMSISYVTGTGSVAPENVHHRPSYAKGKAMPGMLVGGPNKFLEDPFAKAVLKDSAPAKCYVDNHGSYSTNEVTIYWNSPFIYVLNKCKDK